MQRTLLLITLVLFGALSAVAVWQHGFAGILASPFQSLAASQIFADLVVSLSLVMVWLWRDAKATGRKAWPWIAATLVFGSFGPLVYLLTGKAGAKKRDQESATRPSK
jgi:hypothetical protein